MCKLRGAAACEGILCDPQGSHTYIDRAYFESVKVILSIRLEWYYSSRFIRNRIFTQLEVTVVTFIFC